MSTHNTRSDARWRAYVVIDAHTHTRLVLIMTPHAPLTLYAEATPLSFCNRRVPERELPVEGGLHLPVLGLPGQLGDGVAQLGLIGDENHAVMARERGRERGREGGRG